MSVELKELIEKSNKAFEDFKNLNDSRIKALEEKKSVDPLLETAVNKANEEITKLQADIKKTTTEMKDSFEKEIMEIRAAGLGGNGAKDDKVVLADAMAFASMVNRIPLEAVNIKDTTEYKKYQIGFRNYLRKGDKNIPADFQNAMSVGSDPEGGYWVPTTVASRIITKLFKTSPMRQVANIVTIGTDEYELPKDVNDATSGGWVGEKASRTATATPEIGTHKIPVHEQYAMPKITQKLLDDAQFPVESWLEAKVADKMSRTENTAFVSGSGVLQPKGFACTAYTAAALTTADASRAWGVLQYHYTGAAGAFKWTDSPINPAGCLIDLVHKMNAQYRQGAVWVMNSLTLAECRKLRSTQGEYFLIPDLGSEGITNRLLGYPVVEFEDMADIASNSYSIAFGNFQVGYQIVDRIGFRTLRDPYTDKPYIVLYTTKRVGGDVVNFDAIKLLKFATS